MEKRQFRFGGMLWHEIGRKVDVVPLMDLLNEQIDLNNYGDSLQIVYFTFMVPKANSIRGYRDSFRYSKIKKTLSVYKRMDYYLIEEASESETLRLMGECFLETLQTLHKRKLINFDTDAFLGDVKRLLDEEYLVKLVA